MIKIDLNDTFEATSVSQNLKIFTFNSELKNKTIVELHVLITKHPDNLLPNVFNLAFGPIDENGEIDDNIILKHENVNKVFSTVLFYAITFLVDNNVQPYAIGIDGSNEVIPILFLNVV